MPFCFNRVESHKAAFQHLDPPRLRPDAGFGIVRNVGHTLMVFTEEPHTNVS